MAVMSPLPKSQKVLIGSAGPECPHDAPLFAHGGHLLAYQQPSILAEASSGVDGYSCHILVGRRKVGFRVTTYQARCPVVSLRPILTSGHRNIAGRAFRSVRPCLPSPVRL